MASTSYIDRAAVAACLGHTLAWFYHHEARLVAEEGFPPPALGRMRGARWDPVAIDQWKAGRPGRAHPTISPGAPAVADADLDAQRAELDRRSAALNVGTRRRRA